MDSADEFTYSDEFYSLGFSEIVPLSALHDSGGVGDLLDIITKDIDKLPGTKSGSLLKMKIAIKPNAGKSSI